MKNSKRENIDLFLMYNNDITMINMILTIIESTATNDIFAFEVDDDKNKNIVIDILKSARQSHIDDMHDNVQF